MSCIMDPKTGTFPNRKLDIRTNDILSEKGPTTKQSTSSRLVDTSKDNPTDDRNLTVLIISRRISSVKTSIGPARTSTLRDTTMDPSGKEDSSDIFGMQG